MKFYFFLFVCTVIANSVSGQSVKYISTDKAVEDIQYMIKTIEEVHYNPYFQVEKVVFNTNKSELLAKLPHDSIPLKRFVAISRKLAGQLSGGHTLVNWQLPGIVTELKEYQFIPFIGELSENQGLFMVTRSAVPEVKTGMNIKSINGIDMVDLYKECMTLNAGIESFKGVNCRRILPFHLYFTEKITAPYTIEIADCSESIAVTALSLDEVVPFLNENQKTENYTYEMIHDSIGLISYNSCTNPRKFKRFLNKTFKDLSKQKVTKLIIDIRENGGGDSGLNDQLLAYITTKPYRQSSGRFWKVSQQAKDAYSKNVVYEQMLGKVFMKRYAEAENQSIIEDFSDELVQPIKPKYFYDGKTCFLIGPNTFSSANFLADAIKTYSLSTLIGSATGELTNDFGEQLSFLLPNSGAEIFVSSTYDIGANGDPRVFEPVYPDIDVKVDILEFAIQWVKEF